VESSCELGNEPSDSIKCWELPSGCTACGLSSDTQVYRYMMNAFSVWSQSKTIPVTGRGAP
jgi:hypothetical protein